MTHDLAARLGELGSVRPRELSTARDTSLWALQVVAAASTWLPAAPDHHHTNFFVRPGRHVRLAGRPLTRDGLRVALELESRVVRVERHDVVRVRIPLEGHTVDAALDALTSHVRQELGASLPPARRPAHDLPPHPVADGAPFEAPRGPCAAELGRWLAVGAEALARFLVPIPRAGELRGWPHHFDLASLIPIDATDDENARSVNVGFSPGDAAIDEPYFYVGPWPRPRPRTWPTLTVGRWHPTMSIAYVRATELLAASNRLDAIDTFLGEGLVQSLVLVGA